MITGRTSHAAACRQRKHTCIALGPKPDLDCLPLCRVGVLYNTPRDPRLATGTSESPVLPSCPGALWNLSLLYPLLLHMQWRSPQWPPQWPLHQNPISPLAIHQLGQLENLRLQGRDRESQEENGNVCATSSYSLQGICPLPQSPRMPRLPSQGGPCPRSAHQDPSPRGL